MVKVQVVVTDANILINLIHIGRLSILARWLSSSSLCRMKLWLKS